MCIKVKDLKNFNVEEIKNMNDNLIVLNGKINCGKTTIAIKLANNASYRDKIKTLFFSLEKSESSDSNYLTIYDRPITIKNMFKILVKLKSAEEFKFPDGTKARYVRYLGHGEAVTDSFYNSLTQFVIMK